MNLLNAFHFLILLGISKNISSNPTTKKTTQTFTTSTTTTSSNQGNHQSSPHPETTYQERITKHVIDATDLYACVFEKCQSVTSYSISAKNTYSCNEPTVGIYYELLPFLNPFNHSSKIITFGYLNKDKATITNDKITSNKCYTVKR